MKKLIFILCFIPFFGICQEDKTYERIISLSELYEELNKAQENSTDLIIEDCIIKYDEEKDSYLPGHYGDAVKKIVSQNDTARISLFMRNCKTELNKTELIFSQYNFNELKIVESNLHTLIIDSCSITRLSIFNTDILKYGISVKHSTLNSIEISRSKLGGTNAIYTNRIYRLLIDDVEFLNYSGVNLKIKNNEFISSEKSYTNAGRSKSIKKGNSFVTSWLDVKHKTPDVSFINDSIATYRVSNVEIYNSTFSGIFELDHNEFNDSINNNLLLVDMNKYNYRDHSDSLACFQSNMFIGRKRDWRKTQSYCIPKNKVSRIKQQPFRNNLIIRYSNFDEIRLGGMTLNEIIISDNNINKFYSSNVICDGIIDFSENSMQSGNPIDLDIFTETSTVCVNTVFPNRYSYYSGDNNLLISGSDSTINQLTLNEKNNDAYKKLISTYLGLISISKRNGDESSYNLLIKKMRDIQTNRKKEEYLVKNNIDTYFNWRGNQFLKWFCEYGLNPFKGLANCFKSILLFACVYFFFYSDWDRINRLFLVRKLNTAINYFATDKKIEDFYSDGHSEEMVSFEEFKNTLQENKTKIPRLFIPISKPLYQVSYLRQKGIDFIYRNLEFMAGRKWVDLSVREKYVIGSFAFIVFIGYIIYLIFVRIINSIFLSINTFSTLGFGQIPVKGFIRYVTILEGFLGWFLLSVFIVSLLNQMLQF